MVNYIYEKFQNILSFKLKTTFFTGIKIKKRLVFKVGSK